MTVDNAGRHELSRGIDDLRVGGSLHSAHRGDLSVTNQNVALLQCAVRDGENSGIADQKTGAASEAAAFAGASFALATLPAATDRRKIRIMRFATAFIAHLLA